MRKEVPEAVATCHRAGILVRMVTGDNIHTARHIAKECGILTEGGIALEGPKFRELPEEEMLKLLPRLQVSHTKVLICATCPTYVMIEKVHAAALNRSVEHQDTCMNVSTSMCTSMYIHV